MIFSKIAALASAALIAGGLAASPALAQRAAPAKKSTTAKAAKKTPARKSTKKAKRAKSACAGLTKSACTTKKQCGWIQPKKKVSKDGRKLTPYCRKVAGIARKKKTAKKPAKKKN